MGQVNGNWLVIVKVWVWAWMWDLWRKKWHLDGVSHSTLFTVSVTFHQRSILIHSHVNSAVWS